MLYSYQQVLHLIENDEACKWKEPTGKKGGKREWKTDREKERKTERKKERERWDKTVTERWLFNTCTLQ